jgi:putative toxin-antitoxin system antitoxin component (TIGR02293 family)
MTAAEYVIEALGGVSIFKGGIVPTPAGLRERVERGLPYKSLESVRGRLQLTVPEFASVLNMPPRTLARRKQARKLDADESDRLYRLARMAAHAVAVFGTEDKAAAWLRRPNRALNGEPPVRLLGTDIGARQVEDILGRLEHGLVG